VPVLIDEIAHMVAAAVGDPVAGKGSVQRLAESLRVVAQGGSSLFGVAYGDCDVSVVTVLGS